jgi:hypothetical protein
MPNPCRLGIALELAPTNLAVLHSHEVTGPTSGIERAEGLKITLRLHDEQGPD